MKPLRVLVIDDEPVICDACRMVLGEAGHRVDYRRTGRGGRQAMEAGRYDLVLLDMKLPDLDGLEVLETIRRQRPALRVIVMTGYSTLANAVQAMKLGAADYLAKPFTDDELTAAIDRQGRRRRPTGATEDS